MTKRRDFIKTMGLSSAVVLGSGFVPAPSPKAANFKYCLNTSTIRGQNPGLIKYIEIAAKAGYEGIELWVEDIKNFIEANSANRLKKIIEDNGIKVENAIGFAPWMAADEEKSKAGFEQMGKEMDMLASIGCKRVAAPAIGNEGPIDLMRAGKQYKELIELGRSKGVMPQLEFWGAFGPFHHLGQTMMVAAVANDPDAKILADVYHLFRGGSGYDGLKLLSGQSIDIFHMNDYVDNIPREKQEDKDRVYPGDGAAPMEQILSDLNQMGGEKILSLELFNRSYWEKDPLEVAKTGLDKMKSLVAKVQ
ncbi:sugar phosphate isomerase/epimerase family protein [Pleomorphovibrio marinus]|uniref:sugar phosphate isomerase/epimerase family protein n=1 Tax=Pleomorphovibrio marinus TaxID=2164132 RepID=UPI000E09FCD4|nr:sugar phosphate isomerase/epimerase [Pleomorphovibrio marinus]